MRASGERLPIGGTKQRLVLTALVLGSGGWVGRDALVDVLWPADPPPSARHTIESYVSRLRSLLRRAAGGRDLIEGGPAGYRLITDGLSCDATRFAALAQAGELALGQGATAEASAQFGAALALWRGAALEGLADHPTLRAEAAGLEEGRAHVLERWAEAELALGRHGALSGRLRTESARYPGRERLHELLILALYRASGQADALAAYREYHAYLSRELGLEPGVAVRELQAQVLRQDPSLIRPARPTVAAATARGAPDRPEAAAEQKSHHHLELPEPLALRQTAAFVGRSADVHRLHELYAEAATGLRHVMLLGGEAGIGKTRLCMEFATQAHARGALVLYGRCDEDPLVPYQPFVEALRHYVLGTGSAALGARLGTLGGELRRILPEVGERLPGLPQAAAEAEGARFRLFEAVCALLLQAAHAQPLVLVLDDLHWADRPTLQLLKYLARYPRQAPMLVVGTYRPTDIQPGDPLADTLADLSREQGLVRHMLGRLDAGAVGALVGAHGLVGERVPEIEHSIYAATDGNPFFVVEVLRHLTESGGSGAPLAVPPGVKDVIARRLARLSPDVRATLATASVLGRNFDVATLSRISPLGEDELVDALEDAVSTHVVEEVAGSAGEYAFAHALTRDTVYGGIPGHRRAALHRRAGVAIETAHAAALGPYHSDLARHFEAAGQDADLRRAIEHAAQAGQRELAQLADEAAAAHFRRAAALVLQLGGDAAGDDHTALLLAQGIAERQGGDPAFRATLLRAARLAQESGNADRLAAAALANNRDMFSASQGVDRERVATMQAALAALPTADSPTRAELLALLAAELLAGSDWGYRRSLADEALAMARRLGEPRTLALVLNRQFVALWGPATLDERSAAMREAEDLADAAGDPVLAYYAAGFGSHAAMEAGELDEADRLIGRLAPLAHQLRQPILHWYDHVTRAKRHLITGDPGEAERLAGVALALGEELGQPDARSWFLIQVFAARLLGGTLGAGNPSFPELAALPGLSVQVRPEFTQGASVPLLMTAMRTVTFCELGALGEGGRHYRRLMAERRLENLPHDYSTLALAALAALGCVALGDQRGAPRLHALLAPYDGQFVDGGTSWLGATSHYLGLLELTMGRTDAAESHLAAAGADYERLGATAWQTRLALHAAALAPGGPGAGQAR